MKKGEKNRIARFDCFSLGKMFQALNLVILFTITFFIRLRYFSFFYFIFYFFYPFLILHDIRFLHRHFNPYSLFFHFILMCIYDQFNHPVCINYSPSSSTFLIFSLFAFVDDWELPHFLLA